MESKMTVHDLAMIRRAILTVLDDGDPQQRGTLPWELFERRDSNQTTPEWFANQQRLDFCSAVERYITKEIGEAKDNG